MTETQRPMKPWVRTALAVGSGVLVTAVVAVMVATFVRIDNLQQDVDRLERHALTPGPRGPRGPAGATGPQGAPGPAATVATAAPGQTGDGGNVPESFGDGMYQVGTDIEPGTYRSTANADKCFWHASGAPTWNDDVSGGDARGLTTYRTGPWTVTLTEGTFETDGCGYWTKQ